MYKILVCKDTKKQTPIRYVFYKVTPFFVLLPKFFRMREFLLTFSIITFWLWGMAQNTVQYDIEPAIENIQNDYIRTWDKVGEMNGYRIQIAAVTGTNSKSTAENEKTAFQLRFPEMEAYISYTEPYFRIRIGNFLTRLDAYRFLQEIVSIYPNAYIVPDKIN